MDYSYYNGAQTQPFSLYGLHGIPTPDQNQTPHATDDLQDPFSSLVCFSLPPFALRPSYMVDADVVFV